MAQWIRVRSILRPKLAQKLAEEAKAQEARLKAEKDGVVSGVGDEHHEEDHQEGEEEEKERERREKEKREKEEKEKKEKESKEKESKERERLVEAEALAGRGAPAAPAAQEAGGPPAPGETVRTDDEDEEEDDEFDDDYDDEDYEPLYERQPEDVEYEDDPFYGRPWSTEVPKVGRRRGGGDCWQRGRLCTLARCGLGEQIDTHARQ